MAIHYKNPQTGEYEVIKIPVVRGEQGHAGIHVGSEAPPTTDIKLWFDPSDTSNEADLANRLDTTLEACYDYMGNDQGSIKGAADANVEYLLREVNTAHHEGTSITATDTYQKQVNHVLLKGTTKYKDKATGEIVDTYQDGKNLELVSTKTPTLKMKNKFNADDLVVVDNTGNGGAKEVIKDKTNLCLVMSGRWSRIVFNFKYEVGKTYNLSFIPQFDKTGSRSWCVDFNKDGGGRTTFTESGVKFSKNFVPTGDKVIQIADINGWTKCTLTNFVISEVEIKDKPYQESVLTTPSDLELRGIGDVQDTLDLITGEVVSKFEYLNFQDGNFKIEQVATNDVTGYSRLWVRVKTDAINNHSRINKYYANNLLQTFSTEYHEYNAPCECISYRNNGSGMNIVLKTNRVESPTIENFKRWLENNMTPILYDLKPQYYSSKVIDLKGQKVYSYDGTTHYTCTSEENHPAPILSIGVPTNLSAMVVKQKTMIQNLEKENQTLSNELQLSIASSNEVDNDLLAQSFELDFRLMEIEFALNLPISSTFQLGSKTSAMTPYEMAKKLILAGNYDREVMEYKLKIYADKKRMVEVEYQELIQLMDDKESINDSIVEHEVIAMLPR